MKRAAELGFRPQKEISYNKLLPYAADIDGGFNNLAIIIYLLGDLILLETSWSYGIPILWC